MNYSLYICASMVNSRRGAFRASYLIKQTAHHRHVDSTDSLHMPRVGLVL